MGIDCTLYNLKYMKRVHMGRWYAYSDVFKDGQLYTASQIEEIINNTDSREIGGIEEQVLLQQTTISPDGIFVFVSEHNELENLLTDMTKEPVSKLKSVVQDLATVTPNIDPNNLSVTDKAQLYAIAGYFSALLDKIKPPKERADITMQELKEGKKYNDL